MNVPFARCFIIVLNSVSDNSKMIGLGFEPADTELLLEDHEFPLTRPTDTLSPSGERDRVRGPH
jgi:hypothetical protein